MSATSFVLVERAEGVATVTINRADKLNALSPDVLRDLEAAIAGLRDGEPVRCAIVTGAGDKAFVAGADIAAMQAMTGAEAKAFGETGHRVFGALELLPFPVIAAVNGFALGGGCELALACDFIYASDRARLGLPEVGLGVIPGFGGTQRLARRVGVGRARELVYTGDVIGADAALAIGLVNAVVPHAELLPKVREVAAKIASKGPFAVAQAKRVILRGEGADLVSANELEVQAFAALFGSADQQEGMAAFVEKRKPTFRGF